MKKRNLYYKFFITAFTLGFLLWFGGSIVRTALAYDLYIPGTKILKEQFTEAIKLHTLQLYALTATYTIAGYLAAFISAIFLCIYWRKSLKSRGWLFMAFVLFFLASPVQLYTVYLDIRLSLSFYFNEIKFFSNTQIIDYFLFRFDNIPATSATALAFLAIITAIIYIIWQPLDMLRNPHHSKSDNEPELKHKIDINE
ncbi:MAG: hypothetical protein HW421_2683 [Ignavibacteria bacterium]|nr:hypothetical protein [Ignavibacteria bacterium]